MTYDDWKLMTPEDEMPWLYRDEERDCPECTPEQSCCTAPLEREELVYIREMLRKEGYSE